MSVALETPLKRILTVTSRQVSTVSCEQSTTVNNSLENLNSSHLSSSVNPSIQVYNGSMQNTQNPNRIFATFHRMKELGLNPNIDSWNCLIEAQLALNNLQEGLETFSLMSCEPTEESFNILLDRFTKHRSLSGAVRTTIQLAIHRYSISTRNPNILFYTCLLHLACDRLVEAIDSYRMIYSVTSSVTPRQMSRLLVVTSGFVKYQSFFKILLQDLKRHFIFIDHSILFRCLHNLTNTNGVDEVKSLFSQLVQWRMDEGLLIKCLYLANRTNDFQFAIELLRKMQSQEIDLSTCHSHLKLWLESAKVK